MRIFRASVVLAGLCAIALAATAANRKLEAARTDEPNLEAKRSERPQPLRAILVHPDRISLELLKTWKHKGINAIVATLDRNASAESIKKAASFAQAESLKWYVWIETARDPETAQAHPDWTASVGKHHDDWKRLFKNPPRAAADEEIKAWPWVPIGYAPAYEAHLDRVRKLLAGIDDSWTGVFLNDLQAGPSSCGCGNDQCRWAIDYGNRPTAPKTPGEGHAARFVGEIAKAFPGKEVIPVWVTECEFADLRESKPSTGLCGDVGCATGTCWKAYLTSWNALLDVAHGRIAVGIWSQAFHRDRKTWPKQAIELFKNPLRGGRPLEPDRALAVLDASNANDAEIDAIVETADAAQGGRVIALDRIEQGWEPRAVKVK